MISIDVLFLWAKEIGIKIIFTNLKNKKSTLGLVNISTKTIMLDNSLKKYPRRLKCVLAEEMGYILNPSEPGQVYYSKGQYLNHPLVISNPKTFVDPINEKALDWATNVLMPTVEVLKSLSKNINTIDDLADYFEVEWWFVLLKIKYLQRKARNYGFSIKWSDIFLNPPQIKKQFPMK